MTDQSIIPPAYQKTSFHCPHCGVKARQYWHQVEYRDNGFKEQRGLYLCICEHCEDYSLWRGSEMVFPDKSVIEIPNKDLSEDILKDYLEAVSIINKSPRGAAALLRLAIQKLCKELGQPGKDLNKDIAKLVSQGLPKGVQKALDIVRVTGNESVHPGQIDISDDIESAKKLFRLVNFIAEKMITQPKEIDALYDGLPEDKRKQIDQRDSSIK